jgi:hypothetical protein
VANATHVVTVLIVEAGFLGTSGKWLSVAGPPFTGCTSTLTSSGGIE